MDYTGEHLLPGILGHFFITLSLVASLVATFAYFKTTRSKNEADVSSWKTMARGAFLVEVLSVFAIFGILFYIIYNHLFEYKYAWQHSSRTLEVKYLLSCFWEGQEGSFLLWSIWHCVLGSILIRKARNWEAPVMTVVSFAQVCLATMIAGIFFFNWRMGSNPFVLLRNEMDAPIFSQPNYLSLIKDGNDLNPLLQNYWMVIHPPVLFLGFASTIVPFAFAVAGLWTKKFGDWTKPALPWALFSAAVLGTGVMMGGRWAYESLNFGGYWAWDPVENASLVPWLTLIGGIHTLLIYKNTGHSLRATHFLFIITFNLVLYSTFLTRSGILGDTSVHAFTDLGMNFQLFTFMYVFMWLPAIVSAQDNKAKWIQGGLGLGLLILSNFIPFLTFLSIALALVLLMVNLSKGLPQVQKKEEETSSREFWMFVGSLVIFLSAALIIGMTSIPVFNKLMSLVTGNEKTIAPLAMGEDVVFTYNRIQIFVAVIIGVLTAIGQYLKYRNTTQRYLFQKLMWPTVAALIIGSLILAFGNIDYRDHGIGYLGAVWLAIVAAVYAVIANGAYIWLGIKGRLKLSGGSIAHLGFGMLLLGILISSSKKEVLSYNTTGIFIPMGEGSKEKPGENLTLVKGLRTDMGKFWITYDADSTHPKKPLWYYHLTLENKKSGEHFALMPNAFVNYKNNAGIMANPDAKHYWDHDVFAYITATANPDKTEDTTTFRPQALTVGDTVFYSKGYAVLENLESHKNIPGADMTDQDSATVATLKVNAKTGSIYTIKPILITKGGQFFGQPDTATAEGLIVQLQKVAGQKAELGVKEDDAILQYITLKAYNFP